MATNEKVQKLFLTCMSSVYLIAFVSLFVQIPGLYGDNGILPVRLSLYKGLDSTSDILTKQPTLLHFLARSGFTNTELNLNLLTLLGVVLAFVSFVSHRFRNVWTFAIMWVLYQSVVQVGQTFLWFQWDTLLLEAGLLAMLLAPLKMPFINMNEATKHSKIIAFWLVKWLVFRLMFCSGVVKLNSECPTWWGLTAMNYHYESQCIPTPLSWFFHHLPNSFHRFSTAMVFLIQIASSILFFSPFHFHKIFSFIAQTSLMVVIALTGNYNFFNILTIFLLLSLLNDQTFSRHNNLPPPSSGCSGTMFRLLKKLTHVVVLSYLGCIAYYCLGITTTQEYPYIHANLNFSLNDFHEWLDLYIPITIWVASLSLTFTILTTLARSLTTPPGFFKKVTNLISTALMASIAIIIFSISLVPYTDIHTSTQNKLPPKLFKWYNSINHFNSINAYGLFRGMTGVVGRPEVVVEGQGLEGGEWIEYEFLYKPGNVDRVPPFVAPHQPRLDWQLWFAALGSYQHNPWFINMIYRLLNNQQEVIDLIDTNPFINQPPNNIRAQLYHYHYTPYNQNTTKWWRREWVKEYMPATSLQNLHGYVKGALLQTVEKSYGERYDGSLINLFINYLHAITPPQFSFEICFTLVIIAISCLLLDSNQPTKPSSVGTVDNRLDNFTDKQNNKPSDKPSKKEKKFHKK